MDVDYGKNYSEMYLKEVQCQNSEWVASIIEIDKHRLGWLQNWAHLNSKTLFYAKYNSQSMP